MDSDRVQIEIADHIAQVRLTRADKHNGLDWPMFLALNEAIDELQGAEELRAVVLGGDGPSFCAGLDIKSFATEGGGDLSGAGLERTEGQRANLALLEHNARVAGLVACALTEDGGRRTEEGYQTLS